MEKFNDIINGNQLTLVDFFATWCAPCKAMHPVLEQLKEYVGEGIRIIKIDVDKNQALSNAYGIQSIPTLMLFKSGKMLWRQSGAMHLPDLKRVVDEVQG
jgi:thioredoxin